jgi:hypothetical protein
MRIKINKEKATFKGRSPWDTQDIKVYLLGRVGVKFSEQF